MRPSAHVRAIGPYANAILRYQIEFPDDYPQRPPVVVFQSDLFHPLVTPLTTYTYSTRDAGADTQSAVDEQRLPPGGLSLRHGFPEWFDTIDVQISNGVDASDSASSPDTRDAPSAVNDDHVSTAKQKRCPHVIELLQYMRIVFDTEAVLDTIPLTAAANTGAWHAWRSFRENNASRAACTARPAGDSHDRSLSPRKQPGGARPPGEWNWRGVWEDRVRRSVQNTLAEPLLFGGDNKDVVCNSSKGLSRDRLTVLYSRSAFRSWKQELLVSSRSSFRHNSILMAGAVVVVDLASRRRSSSTQLLAHMHHACWEMITCSYFIAHARTLPSVSRIHLRRLGDVATWRAWRTRR